MTHRQVRRTLAAIVAMAALARLYAWKTEPPLHADEFFQYLEPAWVHFSGAGITTWEWHDGIRSWVLPGYHGAWMTILSWLGVNRGATLGAILQAHWSLASLCLIAVGWRGGSSIARQLARRRRPSAQTEPEVAVESGEDGLSGAWGGLLGAALCGLFPLLVTFSVHTLSELPSMLCFAWAFVLTFELCEHDPRMATAASRRRSAVVGFVVGFLVAFAVGLRVANAPLAVVPPLMLIAARRARSVGAVVVGALGPIALFGIVDRLTWGGFFASFVRYVKFNFLDGKAAGFGIVAPHFYVERLFERLPVGLPILLVAALIGMRVTWPYLLAGTGVVAYLSTQAHKEERFIVLVWPLLLVAASGAAGGWLARLENRRRRAAAQEPRATVRVPARFWTALAVALALVVLGDGARHSRWFDPGLSKARLDAQAWIGRQSDVTGVLLEEPYYTGGQLWFGRTLPQTVFSPELLSNPIFSHVLGRVGTDCERAATQAGFTRVFEHDGFVVLRRPKPSATQSSGAEEENAHEHEEDEGFSQEVHG